MFSSQKIFENAIIFPQKFGFFQTLLAMNPVTQTIKMDTFWPTLTEYGS